MISHTKLLLGKVLCDLSWLVVTSVVKRISFCVRCLEEKLVYQILGRDTDSTSLNQDSYIDVVNFKTESGVLVPFVSQVPTVITKQIDNVHECHEDQLLLLPYNVEGLRRSKRRNVQPERYIGSVNVSSEIDVGSFRNRPPVKIDTWKEQDDEELHIPLACLFGLVKNSPEGVNENHEKKASTCRELVMYKRRMNTNQEIKSGENYQNEDQNRLAIVPLPDQVDPLLVEHCDDLDDKVTRSYGHESPEHYSKYYDLTSAPKKSKKKDDNLLAFETQNHPAESDDVEKADDLSLRYHYSYGVPKSKRKNLSGLDDIVDLGNKWEGIRSNKEAQKKKFHASYSRSRDHGEEKRYNYKDRTLNAAAYKDLINSYLKNINTISTQEEPSITDQWKEINTTSSIGQKTETENPDEEDAEEESEMDMLWRELEVSLASSYLEEVCDHLNFAFPYFF